MNTTPKIADAERLRLLLEAQRAAFLRDGSPSLAHRGIGVSGIDAYHGIEGFKRLSHAKGIYKQHRWNFVKLLHPHSGNWPIARSEHHVAVTSPNIFTRP